MLIENHRDAQPTGHAIKESFAEGRVTLGLQAISGTAIRREGIRQHCVDIMDAQRTSVDMDAHLRIGVGLPDKLTPEH